MAMQYPYMECSLGMLDSNERKGSFASHTACVKAGNDIYIIYIIYISIIYNMQRRTNKRPIGP